MTALKPWAYGPFELLQHAEGHLSNGSDFDKRMALISFDNSIEASITTFLQLHPTQRGGRTFNKEQVQKWLANYHSKLRFFEEYAKTEELSNNASVDEIVWFHNLRNELYHSGNGMVPERRALAGARAAAIDVFSGLFEVEADDLLAEKAPAPKPVAQPEVEARSRQMGLLQSFIEFERTLQVALRVLGSSEVDRRHVLPAARAWKLFLSVCGTSKKEYSQVVQDAQHIRNRIVHGEPTDWDERILVSMIAKLEQVTEFVASYGFSFDILPELRQRHPKWMRPDLTEVRVVQRHGEVFLELASQTGIKKDEAVTRTDLSFIVSGRGEDDRMFSPHRTAEENARRFVERLDPYSIINCTDLFTKEGAKEVARDFEAKSDRSMGDCDGAAE